MISADQVDLVFGVILQAKIDALPEEILHAARTSGGESLLHPLDVDEAEDEQAREEDLSFLAPLVGTEQADESYDHAASEAAFEDLFDRMIEGTVDAVLAVLEVPDDERGDVPVPAVMASDFRAAMAEILRDRLCPAMRRSRSIMLLADSHNWSADGDAPLKELLGEGEANNPLFFAWDDRWAELRPPADPAKGKKAGKKGGKGAASLLSVLPGKKKKQPAFLSGAAKAPGAAEKAKAAKAFWAELETRAGDRGYHAPRPADIDLFQSLLRYDVAMILRAWDEVSHLYQQEFEAKAHQEGREGSLRDALNKWHNRLPLYAGEFLAIKCFFAFTKCDAEFMRKYSITHGAGDGARRRAAPYLMQFLDGLSGA